MSIDNIKNKLQKNSKKDISWREKAKWRKENKGWLDVSFEIAVKVMSALKANKVSGTFPKNQKELAEALDCSPQYISKLLKGQERLGIDTIAKVGKILGIKLLEVPKELVKEGMIKNETSFSKTIKIREKLFFNYESNKMKKSENYSLKYRGSIEVSTYDRRNANNHLKVVA